MKNYGTDTEPEESGHPATGRGSGETPPITPKLLTILNAMLRPRTPWRAPATAAAA